MATSPHPVILIIMDGWAHGDKTDANAIYHADTPFVDRLYEQYPNSELKTWGREVGLPEEQMGNSEVGHMNIGAGRVVNQEIVRIQKQIENGELARNPVLQNALSYAKDRHKPVHVMGLVSDGGVHSHIDHLKGLCDIINREGIEDLFVHAFTDGRDTDPKSGTGFIREIEDFLQDGEKGRLATLIGRYFAMDRDERWPRIKKAYDLLLEGKGTPTQNIVQLMKDYYEDDVTDEFMEPIVKVNDKDQPIATISEGEVVLCFNFRTDRCRQITQALTQQDFPDEGMETKDLYFVTMTEYDKTFKNVKVLLDNPDIEETIGEVLANHGKKQIRIAETEKYPHVTYFFSGRREEEFEGEKRIIVHSPKVATYDLQPEMSAYEVRDRLLPEIKKQSADFVCLNFANPDMVGHTGDFEATVKAVETVDECTRDVVQTALENDYYCLVTSDHGNADYLINEDGTPNTAHTKNWVPCFLVGETEYTSLKRGKLGDLAPTILTLMNLPVPDTMTGTVLVDS